MNARPTSGATASPMYLVTAAALGSSLILADAAGSLILMAAQFVSPSMLIWNLGLAYMKPRDAI